MPPKRKKTTMTAAHKAALAEGRTQGRAVRSYLEALEQNRPKRGRKRTPESVKRQLAAVAKRLPDTSGTTRLDLLQQRRDLESTLEGLDRTVDLSALEKGFVKAARHYGGRKGISYATWREFGVSAEVLARAGIGRGA